MDYPTEQFIADARKLIKQLERIADLLQQQTEAINKSTSAYTESRNTPTVLRAELDVPESVIRQAKTPDAQEDRRERIRLHIEFWGAILLLVYVIFSGFQWVELNTGNINQSAANLNAAVTADRTLRQGQQVFETQERAWVSLWAELVPTSPNTPPGAISYQVNWKNTGATPGLEAHLRQGTMYKERDYLVESDLADTNTVLMNPRKKSSRTVVAPSSGGHTEVWAADLPQPNKYLYLLGEITYVDVFGKHHITTYCQRFARDGLLDCNLGNKMK